VNQPPGFWLQLLGRFRVEFDGRVVIDRSWSRRKAQAVIKLLALQKDHAAHREVILQTLWPELEPGAAANNLHKNLHHIRTLMARRGVTAPLVNLHGEMVELAPGATLDVDEFRNLARGGLLEGDLTTLERAAALYAGDLLSEDNYEDWTAGEREALRSTYTDVMFELALSHSRANRTAECIDALQALLRSDPLNEQAHRMLISAFASGGSRHRALRQYQALSDLLRDEVDAEPSKETRALYQSLLAGSAWTVSSELDQPAAVALPRPAARRVVRPSPAYGREQDLEAVQDLIDSAQAGQGRSLFIWGEAGIGKSHFVLQLMADAEEQGFRTAMTRCSELEASSAYQPFRDVLVELAGAGESHELVRHSSYLRRLLVGSSGHDEPSADSSFFETELFNDVHRLIQQMSQSTPVLICLEDFHEADEHSVKLFHFLARRVTGSRVLLVASASTEARREADVSRVVSSLRREGQATELELGTLSEQAMTGLVESLFGEPGTDPALLREVLAHSEGNPLFASEIVHTLMQEGWVRMINGRWTRRGQGQPVIPVAVQDLLGIRLKRLSPAAQAQVQMAAVYGRELDFPLLRQTLGLSEREALDALDECIEANIIWETGDGYRFRHELLREGIYERLTRLRRLSLHKAIADALASHWSDAESASHVEEVAHHYMLTDQPWLAIPFLLESGRRAASIYANEQALRFYEQALTLAVSHEDQARHVDLASVLEVLGDLAQRMGDTARAVEWFEKARSKQAGAGGHEAVGRLTGKVALGNIILGKSEDAREYINATLLDLTESSSQHVVSRTYYLLAQLHWHSGDHRQALDAAERALVAAGASHDPVQEAQAYEVMALACHSLGDWQHGVELELERQALGIPGFNIDEAFEAHL
jgi:DNA-binding SARP family transcriptional activator